jgi:phosphoribosylamine--glycine ligase
VTILIVGQGGREHALLWRLRRDVPEAWFAFTGRNAGMQRHAEAVDVAPDDVEGVVALARSRRPDLTVIGPEAPLAAGLADALAAEGLAVFGPSRAASEIESSKSFAKSFMARHGIPTAAWRSFTDAAQADRWLAAGEGPVVVKASGLAAGKGALVCADRAEARAAADDMLRGGAFGNAGSEIVIEERLEGRELSVIALTDGSAVRPLLPARDHKRALDGDRGPNTGGMGAVAPVPDVGDDVLEDIRVRVLEPAVRGLAAEGRTFRGALYAGLMLTAEGPRVIEFNARFGDPETEVILPLLEGSLLDLLLACAWSGPRRMPPSAPGSRSRASTPVRGAPALIELEPRWRAAAACCVVAASAGYPERYERGLPIRFDDGAVEGDAGDGGRSVDRARDERRSNGDRGSPGPQSAGTGGRSWSVVFHAGTALRDGDVVTAGGRVLAVTGVGPDAGSARQAAYARLSRISFPGLHARRDIGVAAPVGAVREAAAGPS